MAAIHDPQSAVAFLPSRWASNLTLPHILTSIVTAVVLIDCVWACAGHFDVDWLAYSKVAILSLALGSASLFYAYVRQSSQLGAMLLGTAFLISFSASFSLLNYFLLTVAHSRIDGMLAHIDTMIGVDWPAMMKSVAAYPVPNLALHIAYISVLPQVALLIVCLGWREKTAEIHEFCLALAIGAIIAVAFWTAFPSFGAFSVYELPRDTAAKLNLALGSGYAHQLVELLSKGPGRITPDEVKGLIGFPSFHAAMAVLVVWFARSLGYLRWLLLAWNAVVLIATPIHGGHHVIDVPAGVAVAAISVVLTTRVARNMAHGADFAR